MATFFLILVLIAGCISFILPRFSLAAILMIGFLQDPVRKLVFGEPVYFIVTVGVVFGFAFLRILRDGKKNVVLEPFVIWVSNVKLPLFLFGFILVVQYFHSLLLYGSIVVSTIGLISYLAPFFAIVVGYFLVNRLRDIRHFMVLYIWFGVALGLTVFASFFGVQWEIFKEVGTGLLIYDQGTVLRSYSGFMRTGEVAAWHMATACCFLIMLHFSAERRSSTLLLAVIVVLLLIAIALTGRRKMLLLLSLFGVLYILGTAYYRRVLSVNYFVASIVLLGVGWFALDVALSSGQGQSLNNYLARGSSVFGDVGGRAIDLGLKPISWAISRVGFFGGGLGIASQGSHFFTSISVAGGSGEGGLGKVVVELGIPGLLVVLWVFLVFAKHINSALKLSAQAFVPRGTLPLMLGFAVFLLVNAMTFSVATQVYGDMFILILLGLSAGFLFALPKLVIRAIQDAPDAEREMSELVAVPAGKE